MPKDTLSCQILDKVERAMNNARELRKETGALDEFDPEHLREELELSLIHISEPTRPY